jgi:hypothetical protein
MINDLLLLSGNDIPFPEAQLVIHNPSIKEIGLIGEEAFFNGCAVLNFSKENLSNEDRFNLRDLSEIEILMMMMDNNHPEMRKNRVNAFLVLTLLFPNYQLSTTKNSIVLKKDEQDFFINTENFLNFKEKLVHMFCLKGRGDDTTSYNPSGKYAQEIAEQFAKRRQILAERQGEQKITVLNRYASILATGLRLDLNSVLQYTVFQLYDQFDRYELYEQADFYIRARMAGASGMKEPDNWKKDIHS